MNFIICALLKKKKIQTISILTINEIIISRHPSKYFGIIAFRYYAFEICSNSQITPIDVEKSFNNFKNIFDT